MGNARKKLAAVAVNALVLSLLSACSDVWSEKPVGSEPALLEAAEWEGVWMAEHPGDDGDERIVFFVRIIDAARGEVELAWMERSTDGALRLDASRAHIRTSGETTFVSIGADPEKPYHLIGMLAKFEDHALLWMTDSDRVRRLVEDGTLPGRVVRHEHKDMSFSHVDLGELMAEHYALIDAGTPPIFQWLEPLALRRIARLPD